MRDGADVYRLHLPAPPKLWRQPGQGRAALAEHLRLQREAGVFVRVPDQPWPEPEPLALPASKRKPGPAGGQAGNAARVKGRRPAASSSNGSTRRTGR